MEHHCKTCVISFKSKKYLQQHLKCKRHTEQITKQASNSKHQCKECGKKYSTRQSLPAHKKVCVIGLIPPQNETELIQETKTEETISKTDHQKQMEELKLDFEKEINKMKKEMQKEMQKEMKKELQKEMQKEIQKINIRLEKTDIKTKRKKINKVTRQKIADKQENACGECKVALSPYFELDHIIGLQFGGTDEESNLMALCRECHGKKSIAENQYRKRIQDAIQTILKS